MALGRGGQGLAFSAFVAEPAWRSGVHGGKQSAETGAEPWGCPLNQPCLTLVQLSDFFLHNVVSPSLGLSWFGMGFCHLLLNVLD